MLYQDKILNPHSLLPWIQQHKMKTLVFTNGCFDLLHLGHVDYLQKAKSLGDKLIVGINSDVSVQRLKGLSRPINDEDQRVALIAALHCVDAVILFPEDTPENLIKLVKPNVLVKGGDYTLDNIVGSDFVQGNGGDVRIIPFLQGYSTTNIIDNIIKSQQS